MRQIEIDLPKNSHSQPSSNESRLNAVEMSPLNYSSHHLTVISVLLSHQRVFVFVVVVVLLVKLFGARMKYRQKQETNEKIPIDSCNNNILAWKLSLCAHTHTMPH